MYHKLFEFGVWKTTFKSDLKEYCYDVQKSDEGENKSNVNGWHSSINVSQSEQLKPLISHIEQQTNLFASRYYTNKFKLSHMWININPTGGFNKSHTHAGSMFSGVYYVTTPQDCGNLFFERPNMETIHCYDWSYDKTEYNSLNSPSWWMPSEEHTCYIFPAYMRHYTDPNRSESDRISISFNLE